MGGKFGTRLIDDDLSILFSEVLELLIALQSVLHRVGLIARDMTGNILAVLPGLKLVVRPLRPLGHNGEFAPFHAFDLSDVLAESSRVSPLFRILSHTQSTVKNSILIETRLAFTPWLESWLRGVHLQIR